MTTQTKPQPAAPAYRITTAAMTNQTKSPADAATVYRCFHCAGLGEVPVHYPDERGAFVCNWQLCRHCNGTGQWTEPKGGAA